MSSSVGGCTSFFCKECMIDVFLNFEKAIKEAGIYEVATLKAILR
jgi:hypothetical protein